MMHTLMYIVQRNEMRSQEYPQGETHLHKHINSLRERELESESLNLVSIYNQYVLFVS